MLARRPGRGLGGPLGLRFIAQGRGRRGVLGRVARRGHPEWRQPELLDDGLQLGAHFLRVGVPVGGVARRRARHQVVELRWHACDRRARRGHVVIHPLVCDRQRVVALERGVAGEQLVGQHADGVDVAARTRIAGAHLLGGEIGGGAEDDARRRDLGLGHRADQTEVGDLDLTVVGDQHVLGLHVAVHQPGAVSHRETAEHRRQDGGDGVGWHRTALVQEFTQRAALDELHDEEGVHTVEALVVDRNQAGILESCHGPRLALEAGQELLIMGVARIHHLQRHRPVQSDVETAVHRGHASRGDHAVHAVAAIENRAEKRVRSLAGLHACILDSHP